MTAWIKVVSVAVALTADAAVYAQSIGNPGAVASPDAIVLLDSTGKAAAKPLNDTVVLISVKSGVVAPALIRPIYGVDGRAASGLAAWQSGGSVLFTSADCSTGAHVYGSSLAGARAATQVQTPAGIVLYVGAIGMAITIAVRSILYDNGCSQVTVRQNGLLPVLATLNLSTAYPPPLSFQ